MSPEQAAALTLAELQPETHERHDAARIYARSATLADTNEAAAINIGVLAGLLADAVDAGNIHGVVYTVRNLAAHGRAAADRRAALATPAGEQVTV